MKTRGSINRQRREVNDLMVCKLYELTYEECRIVDPGFDSVLTQFGLSKDDYERIGVEELAKVN